MKRKMIAAMIFTILAAFLVTGCGNKGKDLLLKYAFEEGLEGWKGDFTDLPVDLEEDIYELFFGYAELPKELEMNRKALMISSSNRSDDIFMYIRKQLTEADGIKPNTVYKVVFTVEFATNAPAGAFGIGGPPGEAVFFKVGASATEPLPVKTGLDSDYPYYELSVDKGSQNDEGDAAILIGNVAKDDGSDDFNYALKKLDNKDRPIEVTSDENGNIWLFIGTDSGFEGTTSLYYTNIEVILEKAE